MTLCICLFIVAFITGRYLQKNKYRIVTDGTKFAIQTGWIFKKYVDLYDTSFTWNVSDNIRWCWSDKYYVKKVFDILTNRKIRKATKEELK